MNAIFKREFKAYFRGMTGYIFVAALLLFFGALAAVYNFVGLSSSLTAAMGDMVLVMAVIAPIITMNVIAKERRGGTYRLLYSLPLTSAQIVLGKYFALLALLAIPVAAMATLPLIFGMFGAVNVFGSYSTIFCFYLFGAALLAICMFISSLSDNSVVGMILNFAILVALFAANSFLSLLPVGSVAEKLLSVFGIFKNILPFTYGLFDVTSVIYYLCVIVLFVILTVRSYEKKRLA